MSKKDSIYTEVRGLVEDRLASGVIIRAEWLTSEVLHRHSDIEGEDVWFYQLCARSHVQDIVKRVIAKYGDSDEQAVAEADTQLVLPGFTHLRQGYLVIRNDERVLVPVDLLTSDELETRAAEYEQMARGCKAHAVEIRKFLEVRSCVAS